MGLRWQWLPLTAIWSTGVGVGGFIDGLPFRSRGVVGTKDQLAPKDDEVYSYNGPILMCLINVYCCGIYTDIYPLAMCLALPR